MKILLGRPRLPHFFLTVSISIYTTAISVNVDQLKSIRPINLRPKRPGYAGWNCIFFVVLKKATWYGENKSRYPNSRDRALNPAM